MVVNNEEISLLTCFKIESTVMGFHLYRNNWEPVIGEVLKTCMESQNEVDKYTVAVVDNENNIIRHLPKEKSGKYAKTIFYFLRSDPFNIWDKVFKSGLSKFYGKQPLKNLLSPLLNTLSHLLC